MRDKTVEELNEELIASGELTAESIDELSNNKGDEDE